MRGVKTISTISDNSQDLLFVAKKESFFSHSPFSSDVQSPTRRQESAPLVSNKGRDEHDDTDGGNSMKVLEADPFEQSVQINR